MGWIGIFDLMDTILDGKMNGKNFDDMGISLCFQLGVKVIQGPTGGILYVVISLVSY